MNDQLQPQDETAVVPPPEPGIYYDLTFRQYTAIDAVNHSTLCEMARSPKHYQHRLTTPRKDTTDMRIGRAVHTLALQPDTFADTYILCGVHDRRTNIGKEAYAAEQDEIANAGKDFLMPNEHAAALDLAAQIKAEPWIKAVIGFNSGREVSIVWIDSVTGILCKGRIDVLTMFDGIRYIVDLKTVRDADPYPLRSQIQKRQWDSQAAFYCDGYATIACEMRQNAILAIDKSEYGIPALRAIEEDSIDQGRRNYQGWLGKLAACFKSKTWPGWTPTIGTTGLPAWAIHDDAPEIVFGSKETV